MDNEKEIIANYASNYRIAADANLEEAINYSIIDYDSAVAGCAAALTIIDFLNKKNIHGDK